MKRLTVVIPTYNEEENIRYSYNRIKSALDSLESSIEVRLLYADNHSSDQTRDVIRKLSKEDPSVKYVFYTQNFGYSRSTFYALTHAGGDAVVLLSADMQEPPEIILEMIELWQAGNRLVIGIKNHSDESSFMYWLRSKYYKYIRRTSSIQHIDHFTGFALYDSRLIEVFSQIRDSMPYLRGMVAELAPDPAIVYYTQEKRRYGKSHFGLNKLIDMALLGITSYSNSILRCFTVSGVIISLFSVLFAVVNFVIKLLDLTAFPVGLATIICGLFFIMGFQLVFLGIIGEYVYHINVRLLDRPLVVIDEQNFQD